MTNFDLVFLLLNRLNNDIVPITIMNSLSVIFYGQLIHLSEPFIGVSGRIINIFKKNDNSISKGFVHLIYFVDAIITVFQIFKYSNISNINIRRGDKGCLYTFSDTEKNVTLKIYEAHRKIIL